MELHPASRTPPGTQQSVKVISFQFLTCGVGGNDGYALKDLLSLKSIESLIRRYVEARDSAESAAVRRAQAKDSPAD